MKEKHLTPLEAWDKFYTEYKKPEGNPFPNELIVAQATREGRQTNKGVPKTLGVKRIRRLLDKYAPGKYHFHEGNPYFTTE